MEAYGAITSGRVEAYGAITSGVDPRMGDIGHPLGDGPAFTTAEKTFDDIIRIHIEDELGGKFAA